MKPDPPPLDMLFPFDVVRDAKIEFWHDLGQICFFLAWVVGIVLLYMGYAWLIKKDDNNDDSE